MSRHRGALQNRLLRLINRNRPRFERVLATTNSTTNVVLLDPVLGSGILHAVDHITVVNPTLSAGAIRVSLLDRASFSGELPPVGIFATSTVEVGPQLLYKTYRYQNPTILVRPGEVLRIRLLAIPSTEFDVRVDYRTYFGMGG